MLKVKRLYKSYKNTEAVRNVSFTVKPGEITLLLGPNGAGKSTIIKSISGLIPYKGEVTIDEFKNDSLPAKKIFSYVGEIPYPFDYLTVQEHIDFMIKAYDVKDAAADSAFYLEAFDMDDKKNKLGKELSKGMKQKLSIICGIVVKPKYILFDEPLIGLDPKAIRECLKAFERLKKDGTGILISTHIIESLQDIWDNAVIIDKGITIMQNTKEEFFQLYPSKSLEDIFFELTTGEGVVD